MTADSPDGLIDRDGRLWTSFSGIWYRRKDGGGLQCRGTLTMLDRDFGPLTPAPKAATK